MRCTWNVDEVYSIEYWVKTRRFPYLKGEELERSRLASTEVVILLLDSDLMQKNLYYCGIQVMAPARNINVLLSKEQVFSWLEQKPGKIVEEVQLTLQEIQQLEEFLYDCRPYYHRIKQLRARRKQEEEAHSHE